MTPPRPLSRRRALRGAASLVGALAVGLSARPVPAITAALDIRPRSAWADRPPTGPIDVEADGDVRFLLVHHTASSNGYTEEDVPRLLRGFAGYHTGPEKGWPDIAYNFLIDRFGGIWEGRQGSIDWPVIGSATGGNQGFSQLACFIGDHSEEAPSQAAQTAMTDVLAMLADRYGIDTSAGAQTRFTSRGSNRHPQGTDVVTSTIAGHRSMSQTACPGDAAMRFVTDVLPDAVTQRRGLSAAPAEPVQSLPDTPPDPSTPETVTPATSSEVPHSQTVTNNAPRPATPAPARQRPATTGTQATPAEVDQIPPTVSTPTRTPIAVLAIKTPNMALRLTHPGLGLIGLGMAGLAGTAAGPILRRTVQDRAAHGRHEAGSTQPKRMTTSRAARAADEPLVNFVEMLDGPSPSCGWAAPDPAAAVTGPLSQNAQATPGGTA